MTAAFTTRPEILGTFGAVTSTHWLASASGMAMLERGGNAFDAAVAAGFVLQIVEPHLNGPGGEVPILLWPAGTDEPQVLCGQGVAPAAATIGRFRDLGLRLVPGTGLLPAMVPGAFDAWMQLLRDYGTLELEEVLAPAIGYAEEGFPLVARGVEAIWPVAGLFEKEWPSSAAVWLPDGRPPRPGARFATPAIAATYRRILEEAKPGADREARIEAAREAFYRGFVAEAIDRFYRDFEASDSSGRRHRGLLTGGDMAGWQAHYESPVFIDYHGCRVYKTGPWGQGPVFLQQLALLKGFDLAAMDPLGPDFAHTVIECAKLAFADRDVYYGDPDFVAVPLETLLSEGYNEARRKEISTAADEDLRPGDFQDVKARVARLLELAGSEVAEGQGGGEPTVADLAGFAPADGDTVHLDVIDRHGNMVSATPSGGWLQSAPVVPGLGFPLGTRGQMFWLSEELPSSLAPGKRPRTTLSPTMVARDGRPWLAIGTPGGDQQDQWSLTVFLRHLHHGLDLQAAIDAPQFHSRHMISSFHPRGREAKVVAAESRFSQGWFRTLTERGHVLARDEPWSIGRVCAAARDDGLIKAAANPRFMQGYAVGR
ncbi:MAG: gamma-glutamyltransferase family protein [Kiloniellales bacterium]|nr:gamma-glutamyltransferase family protein [Kiloniellales bacterium]